MSALLEAVRADPNAVLYDMGDRTAIGYRDLSLAPAWFRRCAEEATVSLVASTSVRPAWLTDELLAAHAEVAAERRALGALRHVRPAKRSALPAPPEEPRVRRPRARTAEETEKEFERLTRGLL